MRKRKPPATSSLQMRLSADQAALIRITPPPLPGPAANLLTSPPAIPGLYELTRIGKPSVQEPASGTNADPGPASAHLLRFSTGETIAVTGNGVVGRNPAPDPSYSHIVIIDDHNRLLSRTHFTFGLTTTGQLWACDQNSGNGTYLNGQPLTPGNRVALAPGSILRFGDHTATAG